MAAPGTAAAMSAAWRDVKPCSAERSVRCLGGGNEHGGGAIDVREEALEVVDLGQIVVDDVGVARVPRQEVLMIVLGGEEFLVGLDLGDDRRFVDPRLVELGDVGL